MATEEIKIAGLRLKLEGENEFQKGLRDTDQAIKVTRGEYRLYDEQQKLNKATADTLRERQRLLTDQIEAQSQKLRVMRDVQAQVAKEKGEDSVESQKLTNAIKNGEIELAKYENQLKQVTTELKKQENGWLSAGKKMDEFGGKLTKAGKQMKKTGDAMSKTVTAPLLAIGTIATKAAIDFETAMTGVRKTTDLTNAEFAALTQGLRDMSKEIPISVNELAGLAESAGQLGIEKENLLDFTRVMADLNVATNITGQEGAANLARFANITQMSQKDFDRLGSTIVELGNNSATTEAEILDMAMRLAGAGAQAGMSEADILGISAALSSLGLESQAGGSAFSKAINRIQLAVDTGSKDLDKFASVAGMSASEFKTAWEQDAANALSLFIIGLGNAEAQGKTTNQLLEDLGMSEVRLGDAFRRTSGASDLFSAALLMANEAWGENNALTDEASQFYGTTAGQIEIAKNKMYDTAITLGQQLIPHVTNLVEWLTDLVEGFSQLSPEMQDALIKFGAISAAVGPLLSTGGRIISGIGGIATGVGKLSTKLGGGAGLLGTLGGPLGVVALAGLAAGAIWLIGERSNSTAGRIEAFNREMEKSNSELEKRTTASRDQATEALRLVGRIEELNAVEELSTKQKMELKGAVETLNAWYPQLGLTIDEHTGKVEQSTKAIEDHIEMMLAEALTKDYTDTYIENAKKRQTAIDNITKAQNELRDAQAQYDEKYPTEGFMPDFYYYEVAVETARTALAEAEAALAEFDRNQEGLLTSIGNVQQEAADLADGVGKEVVASTEETTSDLERANERRREIINRNVRNFFADAKGGVDQLNELGKQQIANEARFRRDEEENERLRLENMKSARGALVDAREEHFKALEDLNVDREAAQKSHWDRLFAIDRAGNDGTGVTMAEAQANLTRQLEVYRHWQENMELLVDKVPKGLHEMLTELGPAEALLVDQLVNATEEELLAFIAIWQESMAAAREASDEELGGTVEDARKRAQETADAVRSRKNELWQAGWEAGRSTYNGIQAGSSGTYTIGSNMVDGMIGALRVRTPELVYTGGSMVRQAIDNMKIVAYTRSPSKKTYEIGKNIADGLINALSDNISNAARAAGNLADATLSALSPLNNPLADADWSMPSDLGYVGIDPVALQALSGIQQPATPTPISVTVNVDSVRSDQDIDAITAAVERSLYNAEQRARRSLTNVWA